MSLNVRVLIMDEPTASLSAHEVSELFKQIRRLTRPRRRDPLHQPPARRGVRDRRPRHGVPRRAADLDAAARRDHRGAWRSPTWSGARCRTSSSATRSRCRTTMLRSRASARGRLRRRQLRAARARCSASPGSSAPGRTDVGAGAVRDRAGRSPAPSSSAAAARRSTRRARRCAPASPTSPRTAAQLGLSLPMSIDGNITLATLRKYLTRLRLAGPVGRAGGRGRASGR